METETIKITLERSNMVASANCDSETFLEGVCLETDCPHDDERAICCVLCEFLFDCTRPCSKIKISSKD
jgi:hypothetical protein